METIQKTRLGKRQAAQRSFGSKCGIFLALLLFLGCVCIRFYPYVEECFLKEEKVTLTITNLGVDGESKASEIWMTMKKGNAVLTPSEVLSQNLIEDSGWFEKDGYVVSMREGQQLKLQFRVPTDVSVTFQRHPYTGLVSVSWNGNETILHNYAEKGSIITENADWPVERQLDRKPLVCAAVCLLVLLALGTRLLVSFSHAWTCLYACFMLLFVWVMGETRAFSATLLILLTASACAVIWWNVTPRKSQLVLFTHKGYGAAIILLTGYAAFAIAGNQLFMLQSRMVFSASKLVSLLLVAVMIYPIELACLGLFDFIREKMSARNGQAIVHARRVRVISFLLMYGILTLISIGFYPANMSPDSVAYWCGALKDRKLYDNTPIALILFMRLLSYIAQTPYTYIQFQCIAFALVMSGVFDMMYRFGIPRAVVYLLSVTAALLPCNYMSMSYCSSNPLFAILVLWNMLLMLRLLYDPEKYAGSALWIIEMAIAMASVYLVRRNGFTAFAPMIACLLYLTFKYRAKQKTKGIPIAALASCALIVLITGPLYKAVDKEIVHIKSRPVSSLLTPLASCLANDLELPEDILETMDSVYPLENWRTKYNPYNSDTIAHAENPDPQFYKITTAKALSMYFRVFSMYPDVVIKDRLDGAVGLWNVFPCKAPDAFIARYYVGVIATSSYRPEKFQNVEANKADNWYVPNMISESAIGFSKWIVNIPLLDATIWGSGIYIILALLYMIDLVSRRQGRLIWVIMPTVLTAAGLMLLLGWQHFVYRYFMGISVVCFIMVTLCKPLETAKARIEE